MNILEYKKYFFINESALWSLFVLYSIRVYSKTDYPPPAPNDAIAIGGGEFFIMVLSIMILLWVFAFTILEILLRKYVIEKKFPNLKLNIKIKIPKIIVAIYNVIFSIGFISASFLFFIAVLLSVLAMIMWIVNNVFS